MDFWNMEISIIFLLQTTTGILGNFSLIFYYLVLYYRKCTVKPTDVILMNIMVANALIILSTGVPQTMAVWGLKQFLNDFGCKLLLYIQGCGRSVSIGTTCLLSVFQALTICPRKSCWKDHKVKVEKYISCHIFLLWILYMSVNFIYFSYTILNRSSKNVSRKRDFGYCSIVGQDEIVDSLYAALVVCPEVFLSVLIAWSSGSMIVILYRHKQRVQHIRSSHGSSRMSTESRVTQNILILVSNFFVFYTLSSILRGYISLLNNNNWWLVNMNRLTSLCFPSFGPLILMNHYSIGLRLSLVWIRKKNYSISF
ncbi:vomeronasal type-1 receptor 4-like [Microtus oregoni]|uniref:vomeronasal type-1 receptor 4-like n=1 Tax=Microtus oregoni TaxID=111838 RepID=UPI001BB1B09A|nr:vomeronasal type-1 receptor 4-like [Microtus oregoni]